MAYRTDGNANVGNLFDAGDPLVPRPPTQVDPPWLNEVQEEICNAVEAAGITLVKGTRTQLRDAIRKGGRNTRTRYAIAHPDSFVIPVAMSGGNIIQNPDVAVLWNATDQDSALMVTSTISSAIRCKVAIPRGATITAIDILARNANAASKNLANVKATLQELPLVNGATERATTATQLQNTGAGETVAIPSDAVNPSYRSVPMAAGPFQTTDEGYVDVSFDTPTGTSYEVQVFHVRVTYTISELDITALT